MDMRQQAGMGYEGRDQIVPLIRKMVGARLKLFSSVEGVQQLPCQIHHHPADPCNDLIAEQRMIIVGKEMAQDWRDCAKQRVAMRQFVAHDRFDRSLSQDLSTILDHELCHTPAWLRSR